MTKIYLLILLLLGASFSAQALEISVNGLFNGGAILVIDGKHHLLRVGDTTPEGVKLIAASDQGATFSYNGEEQTLGINRTVSTNFSKPEKVQARIPTGPGGHYFTPGRINGLAVDFLVDTGATTIAINLPTAKALGLNYRAGERVQMNTASGVGSAYMIMLDSVRVGDVEVRHVAAAVSMGNYPREILLGNSFLSRVDMRRENGLLILEANF